MSSTARLCVIKRYERRTRSIVLGNGRGTAGSNLPPDPGGGSGGVCAGIIRTGIMTRIGDSARGTRGRPNRGHGHESVFGSISARTAGGPRQINNRVISLPFVVVFLIFFFPPVRFPTPFAVTAVSSPRSPSHPCCSLSARSHS